MISYQQDFEIGTQKIGSNCFKKNEKKTFFENHHSTLFEI